MKFTPETKNINAYLNFLEIINFHHQSIQDVVHDISLGLKNDMEIAEKTFNFVRDEIFHSGDIDTQQVTCKASDVLKYSHGICCAKSHLFAACTRAVGIPTGFCYQKLLSDENIPDSSFSIHGLNAIFLKDKQRWVRLMPVGIKMG